MEIRLDSVIGKLYAIDELLGEQAYDAVFLGTGAGLSRFLGIPGENYNGALSANEFLEVSRRGARRSPFLVFPFGQNHSTPQGATRQHGVIPFFRLHAIWHNRQISKVIPKWHAQCRLSCISPQEWGKVFTTCHLAQSSDIPI